MTGHVGAPVILDPYAGPRGWSEGLRALGLHDIGVELDNAACRTAIAAGHRTIRADVARFPIGHLTGHVDGLIMSPPCQAFSTAGKGEGRHAIDQLAAAIRAGDWTGPAHNDDRIRHVLEVGRWAETLTPTWVACEQVPPVLPLWHTYAARWRAMGWTAWAGILNAADYGVPQTRRRAFLIARTDGRPVQPPEPTHCEGGASTMFGDLAPWVSMAAALGWSDAPVAIDEPSPSLDSQVGGKWVFRQPATTVAGDPRITARCHHDEGSQGANAVTVEQAMTGDYDGTSPIKLTVRDALILQGFPPDYPVQGTRTKQFEQVGNAVPPPLAAAVIAALTGTATRQAAA